MVRETCDTYSEDQRKEILQRLEKRMSTMQENRENQLKQIQERLNEHVSNHPRPPKKTLPSFLDQIPWFRVCNLMMKVSLKEMCCWYSVLTELGVVHVSMAQV